MYSDKNGTKSVKGSGGIKEADLAWLGGVIDSEGCIAIYPYDRRENGRPSWGYAIVISNTEPSLLTKVVALVSTTLGKVPYIKVQHGVGLNPQNVFSIRLQGKPELRRFLEVMTPFLVGKLPQALIMLDVLNCKNITPTGRIRDRQLVLDSAAKLKELKRPQVNAEEMLLELRSVALRNAQVVSLNNNPPKSAPHESENVR